jgi:hypothetical protein
VCVGFLLVYIKNFNFGQVMDKKWFKTKNRSILNLKVFDAIWIEHSSNNQKYNIYCRCEEEIIEDCDYHCMGSFDSPQDAENYLNEIYEFLGKNE